MPAALAAIRALERFPRGLLLLLARIAPVIVFFKSGLTKIGTWD